MDVKNLGENKQILLDEIGRCRACRFCVDVCPTYQVSEGLETQSSFGRIQALRYVLLGIVEPDDRMLYDLYTCLQCRRCENICKAKGQNLDITRLIHLGRTILSGKLVNGNKK